MTDILLTPVPVSELVERIAQEVEDRLKTETPPAPLPDRITMTEAIELTGLTRSSLYKLTMEKKIPFSKFGKRLIFSREELGQWIKTRTLPGGITKVEIMTNRLASSARKKQ